MRTSQFTDDASGRLETTEFNDTEINVFVPGTLPPEVDVDQIIESVSDACYALGELSGHMSSCETSNALKTSLGRIEAIESSRIERIDASLSDVCAIEMGRENTIPTGERKKGAVKTHACLEAIRTATTSLQTSDDWVTTELICEMNAELIDEDYLDPGKFRTRQNWIGGRRPSNARYVPPAPEHILTLMDTLVRYDRMVTPFPDIVDAVLMHYQFEAIHPFLDGNGRVGRSLLASMLMRDSTEMQLGLSEYIRRNQRKYYDLLLAVSQDGLWEEWIQFVLQGIIEQVERTLTRLESFEDLKEKYDEQYSGSRMKNKRELAGSLLGNPLIDITDASNRVDVSYNTANRIVNELSDDGVVREITGQTRNRLYWATDVETALRV